MYGGRVGFEEDYFKCDPREMIPIVYAKTMNVVPIAQ